MCCRSVLGMMMASSSIVILISSFFLRARLHLKASLGDSRFRFRS